MSPYSSSDRAARGRRVEGRKFSVKRRDSASPWGLLALIYALMEADRHFAGIWCHRLAKTDAQSSDRKAARNRTQFGHTVSLLTAFHCRFVFVQQGGWRRAMVTQAATAWSLPKCACVGFFSPDSPASSHSPNTCTLWIIGKLQLSVGVKQAS